MSPLFIIIIVILLFGGGGGYYGYNRYGGSGLGGVLVLKWIQHLNADKGGLDAENRGLDAKERVS